MSEPGKYRKKPIVIEAMQYDGDNVEEVRAWADYNFVRRSDGRLAIRTLEGPHFVTPGDWIIRGVKGELYPCKPQIFELTYEAVS